MPAHAVPTPLQAGCVPRGVPATATHVPTEPVSAQASHALAHALEQQTESTQLPLKHIDGVVQATPESFFDAQVVPAQ